MARTIELGRAVLSSTTAQLWLRTLITLSPQQGSIDIQQHTQAALLGLLHSGDFWICRGNGMHIALELTIEGEPLDSETRNSLAERIIKAPVWEQLLLIASSTGDQRERYLEDENTLLIHIRHSHATDNSERENHRICANVPFADVNPPEGVSIIALDRIRFVMEAVGFRLPGKSRKRKRPDGIITKTGSNTLAGSQSPIHETSLTDESDMLWSAKTCPPSVSGSGGISNELIPRQNKKRRRDGIKSDGGMSLKDTQIHTSGVEKLVDHAIRLCVNKIFPKSVTGVTVAANTISSSLSDIAPNIWRPGYLPGFARRSHLLQTIAQSISRTACSKTRSMSLQDKLDRLAGDSIYKGFEHMALGKNRNNTGAIHAQLWTYLQKSQVSKPAPALLRSFFNSRDQLPNQTYLKSILPPDTSPFPDLPNVGSGLAACDYIDLQRNPKDATFHENQASSMPNCDAQLLASNSFKGRNTEVDIHGFDDMLFSPKGARNIFPTDVKYKIQASNSDLELLSHPGSDKLNFMQDDSIQ
ncbi:hypothetical protein P154DRAFT_618448 [Amniculicola lignicola CBS 123094]|uniref:Sld7 C-terminal domain-containing protein n=1 Tax=Amniculicola lignicola CBS 123094 TaxID=1392246 RepID=A0A6A5WLX9_9PLEO|nr:hypothetical protein P154DRAFT_618448 [Amniculicola lignicola CBS 123094]